MMEFNVLSLPKKSAFSPTLPKSFTKLLLFELLFLFMYFFFFSFLCAGLFLSGAQIQISLPVLAKPWNTELL